MPQHKAWAVRGDALTGQAGSLGCRGDQPVGWENPIRMTWFFDVSMFQVSGWWKDQANHWFFDLWCNLPTNLAAAFLRSWLDLWPHVSDIPGQETSATQAGIWHTHCNCLKKFHDEGSEVCIATFCMCCCFRKNNTVSLQAMSNLSLLALRGVWHD